MQKTIHVQVRVENYRGNQQLQDFYLEINEAIRKFINCKAITGGIAAIWEESPDYSSHHVGELTNKVLWKTDHVKPRTHKVFIQKLVDIKNATNAQRSTYEKTFKREEE